MNNLIIPFQGGGATAFVHINLETNTAGIIQGANNYWPKSCVPLGGKLYFGAGNALKELDTGTGSIRHLGNSGDSNIYTGHAAPDGVIFWGTHSQGRLVSFDPATDTFVDHGRMDDAGPSQYGYSIAADNDYVYVGLGQAPWYLGIYNRATGTKTLHFKDAGGGSGGVTVGVDGSIWWNSYKMIEGEPVAGQPTVDKITSHTQSGANIDYTTWPDELGIEADLNNAIPAGNSPAVIRWRQTGAAEWSEYEAHGLPMDARQLKRVYPFDETRLLLITAAYNPLALCDVADSSIEVLGWTGKSLYDAVKHPNGKWYLSGYAGVTLEWNPAQPWTASQNNPIGNGLDTNPRYACGISKYHHYNVVGSDGVVYIAVNHERDSVGSSLGWYDPDNPIAVAPRIRVGLERWYARGLASVGDVVVMGALSMDGNPGELVIVDSGSKEVIDRQVPLSDLTYTSPGFIIAAGATDVIGLAGEYAYRWNIATDSQVWRVRLPAVAMGDITSVDRRAEIAPDGKIYFFAANKIYALNPADGVFAATHTASIQGNVMWHGGTMYVYGTTNLRRGR